ncbi:DUF192 domain-containing protein [Marinobacter mobilis]|uniref:DUF192 domain-containing protein n=1 Tax=Marinobacter mobilis TaxID=488533 RepID=A0A1H2VCF1_9GAMM|nr:DUF192 domain-containing protein [Marinobacter mobilis]SDW66025.1 hypothetical protein SAMN04487960_103406 [Marinobacter mobilis]
MKHAGTPFQSIRPWLLLALALLVVSACTHRPVVNVPPSPELEKKVVQIVSGDHVVPLTAEIADTPGERRQGLMGRYYMDWDAGMLFVYEISRSGSFGFWMQNTIIPLDIAYLDENGVIASIKQMEPCIDQPTCPVYPAGVRYRSALEVNQGFFEAHGISVGDRVEW